MEMESHYVVQAGLELLVLSNHLASASQSAGIKGLSHHMTGLKKTTTKKKTTHQILRGCFDQTLVSDAGD